jgi:hypothetical protein
MRVLCNCVCLCLGGSRSTVEIESQFENAICCLLCMPQISPTATVENVDIVAHTYMP